MKIYFRHSPSSSDRLNNGGSKSSLSGSRNTSASRSLQPAASCSSATVAKPEDVYSSSSQAQKQKSQSSQKRREAEFLSKDVYRTASRPDGKSSTPMLKPPKLSSSTTGKY